MRRRSRWADVSAQRRGTRPAADRGGGTVRDRARSPRDAVAPSRRGAAFFAAGLLVAIGLVDWSPSARAQESAQADGAAFVGFVHGSPSLPGIDLRVDGALVVQDLEFGAATDILVSVSAGAHAVAAALAGGDGASVVAEQSVDLAAGAAYALVVAGPRDGAAILVYPVDASATSDGRARVRLIVAALDAATVELVGLGDPARLAAPGFPHASDHVAVAAGGYDLALRAAGAGTAATVELGRVVLEAGASSDLVVVGSIADGSRSVIVVRAWPLAAAGSARERG